MSRLSLVRRRLCCASLAVITVLGTAPLRGDERAAAGSAELRQKVERLVSDLDAETRSARLAARDSLLALGPGILPLLPDERTLASAAARDAVGQIRTRLERQSALATLAASRVTLRGRFPLREILDRITRQTGNRFDVTAIDALHLDRPFDVHDQARPFWNACDELFEQAGLTFARLHKPGTLALVPAGKVREGELAVSDGGPFRIAVIFAELRGPQGEAPHLLRMAWTLTAEPRLRPLFASIAADRLVASSGADTFKATTPTAKWELSLGEGADTLRIDSDFEVPPPLAPAQIEFRGAFGVEMAAGPQEIVFGDLASGRRETRRAGSVTVGLGGVEFPRPGEGQGTARIEIRLVYDQGGPAFESYRTWMYHNEAALEAKSGRRIAPRPIITTRQQGDGSVAVEYNFADIQGTPRDYRFVYVAPTLITQLPVEFRFSKIPVARAARGGTRQ
jgi:hypothetical protein